MDKPSSITMPSKKSGVRWYQWSLGTLLIFVTLAGCLSAWLAVKVREGVRQHASVVALRRSSDVVQYDYELPVLGYDSGATPHTPPTPRWLRALLGDDCFVYVSVVKLWVRPDRPLAKRLESAAAFKRLQSLVLSGSGSTNEGLEQLRALTQLEELSLPDDTTDDGLQNVSGLSNLKELTLSNSQVTGAGLAYLQELAGLKSLRLDWKQLTDTGFEQLRRLTHLRRLTLDGTAMTDAKLERLSGLAQLDELCINDGTGSAIAMVRLQSTMPNCQVSWHF